MADDDISSIVAFRDGTTPSIGVFWSNQKGSSFHFAIHADAAGDTTWKPSVGVYPGAGNADDHINLKSLQTDGSGRVFAVVKTSRTGHEPIHCAARAGHVGGGMVGAYHLDAQ